MGTGSAICSRLCPKQRGYFLTELQLSLAIAAVAAVLTCTAVARCAHAYSYLLAQLQLQDAARYMLSNLERGVGLEARTIALDGEMIDYTALHANTKVRFYWSNNGLYERTRTDNGIGVNPLFIEGVDVKNWRVRKLGARLLQISFTLESNNYSKDYTQLIVCYNGEITGDEG